MKHKYHEVAQRAMEIARTSDGRLPSERDLCEICGTSRITTKKAMNYLREKGLVARHVGRGTFIADGVPVPKVTFQMVTANTPPEVQAFFKSEAELYFGSGQHSDVEFVEIGENVISAVQGQGTKIVYWPYIGRFSNLGVFAQLDELPGFAELCADSFRDRFDWFKGMAGQERCLALPIHFGVDVFGFNQRIAAELGLSTEGPQSWDEIIEWGKCCGAESNHPPTVIYQISRPAIPVSYYLNAAGGKDYLESVAAGRGIDEAACERWLSFFRQIHSLQANEYRTELGPDSFSKGQALFRCDVATWVMGLKNARVREELKMIPVPPVENGSGQYPLVSKNCLGIVEGGDRDGLEVAWGFCRHLLTQEAQQRLIDSYPLLAANRAVFATQEQDETWAVFANSFKSGVSLPEHPARFGFNALFREYFGSCMAGQLTPTEAAGKICDFSSLLLKIEKERTWF